MTFNILFWINCGIAGVYLFYDLFVVSLYYYKIHQFNVLNAMNTITTKNKNQERIQRRIRFILNKILFLTLSTQILLILVCAALYIWTIKRDLLWPQILAQFVFALCSVDISYVVFLMMEHNLESYLRYLKWIEKSGFHCFCGSIIDNARPYVEESSRNNNDSKMEQKSVQMTNTKNILSEVKRMEEYHSENTQTNI